MTNKMSKELADLLYPNLPKTVLDYENQYPQRENLPEGAWVSRYAPSPTGFVHIGGLLVSLINRRLATQTNGIFMLRVEDTDKNREVENGVQDIIKALERFGIIIDEGPTSGGNYGSYIQSERLPIYRVFARHLVEIGRAYPCFCTPEQLDQDRQEQERLKIRPGYYGEWARHRNLSVEEVKQRLDKGESFVLRFKSTGSVSQKVNYKDLVKGALTLSQNDLDIVLIKSDGYPTYHFAHVVDDHLMHVNLVLRGDEWLASLPLHLELFEAFGFEAPQYAHIAPIMKIDNGSQRKLSKRKDPEANVDYFLKAGYPEDGVLDYLLNLANSTFDDWRRQNPGVDSNHFVVQTSKIGRSGALFDLGKLDSVCKNWIGCLSGDQVCDAVLRWSAQYDPELKELIESDEQYSRAVFDIERGNEKARKDLVRWGDAREAYGYFWDPIFQASEKEEYQSVFDGGEIKEILRKFSDLFSAQDSKEQWMEKFRGLVLDYGCAPDVKSYKAEPERYRGHIGDIAMLVRVALTHRKNTPDLYEMIRVMGEDRVRNRLGEF